ncbi:MAG: cellulase family glycosylhydrolase [Candidatus Nitrosocaldus sp.]
MSYSNGSKSKSSSLTPSSFSIGVGAHSLEFYAVDMVSNASQINRITFELPFHLSIYGINHKNRILMTVKYPTQPSIPYPKQDILSTQTILQEIRDMGLNAIRITMNWEGYRWYKSQGRASTFLNKVKEIADTADSLGLGIVYSVMHQWKISSVLRVSSTSNNRGTGFPEECLQPLGLVNLTTPYVYDVPIDGSNNVEMTPRNIFWRAFRTNYNVTIDGITKPIWQHIWDDYYKDVVASTISNRSTIGYEVLNEPTGILPNMDTYDYIGLGDYSTFIANKIIEFVESVEENKQVYVFIMPPHGFRLNNAQIERVYPDLAGKSNSYKQAELSKRLIFSRVLNSLKEQQRRRIAFIYNVYGTGQNGYLHQQLIDLLNEYYRILNELSINIKVIGEWNQSTSITTNPTVDTYANGYLAHFRGRFGWFFFDYDPDYPWTIRDSNYNDKINNSIGLSYKEILIRAKEEVYGTS